LDIDIAERGRQQRPRPAGIALGRRRIQQRQDASFARADRTGDQHDAYSITAWFSRADRDGSLAAFLKPDLTPAERTLAQVEGWIFGVA
jgi:hypothetical protein